MNYFQCLWEQDKQQWTQVPARKIIMGFFRHEASSDSLKSLYNEIDGIERLWDLHHRTLQKTILWKSVRNGSVGAEPILGKG